MVYIPWYITTIYVYMYTCVVGIDICNAMCALLDTVYNMATCVCVEDSQVFVALFYF